MKHFFVGRARTVHIQFLRYFFVGGSAAVMDLFVFAVCITYLQMHYVLAACIAYMLGLSWNYLISVFWVFESKHNRAREMGMIFLISLGGLFWTWLILYFLIDAAYVDALIAKMISQILVLFWNFSMRKFYVFH